MNRIKREQTKRLEKIVKEFNELKNKIFQGGLFVEVDNTPDQKRYKELLNVLYPQFSDGSRLSVNLLEYLS